MKRPTQLIAGAALALAACVAMAAPGTMEGIEKQPVNVSAIAMFVVFVLSTLASPTGPRTRPSPG